MEATSRPGAGQPPNLEPDMARARMTAVMAHNVVIKLKEMGLPDRLDEDLARLSTDLGDLWNAQHQLAARVESFLKSEGDWDATADSLVDLKAVLDHMGWHLSSAQRPITRIARFAYQQADGDEENADPSTQAGKASE